MPAKPKNTRNTAPRRKRPTAGEKNITRPLTPAALAAYGALDTALPDGPFPPAGPWTHTYRLWMTGGPWDSYQGLLVVERGATVDGRFPLTWHESLIMPRTASVHETEVTARCRDDALATPLRWRLVSRVVDLQARRDYPAARLEQVGHRDEGRITITTQGRSRTIRLSGPWTWNGALFAARSQGPPPPSFALLDDLDVLKPEQRRVQRGPVTLRWAGRDVSVRRSDQIGRGCLPTRSYHDAAGRLLLVHTELRAAILDPQAPARHARALKSLAAKELS